MIDIERWEDHQWPQFQEVAAAAVDVRMCKAASLSAGGVAVVTSVSAIFTLVKEATAVEVAAVETVACAAVFGAVATVVAKNKMAVSWQAGRG